MAVFSSMPGFETEHAGEACVSRCSTTPASGGATATTGGRATREDASRNEFSASVDPSHWNPSADIRRTGEPRGFWTSADVLGDRAEDEPPCPLRLLDVRGPVVELRRLRRGVAGNPLRVLERPPVRQTRRDARRPKRVAAGRRRQPRARRLIIASTARRPKRPPRQPAGPVDALKQRRLRILNAAGGDIRCGQPVRETWSTGAGHLSSDRWRVLTTVGQEGIRPGTPPTAARVVCLESFLGPVVGWHVVALAALLVESGRRWPAAPFAFENARMVPSTTLLLVASGRERTYG